MNKQQAFLSSTTTKRTKKITSTLSANEPIAINHNDSVLSNNRPNHRKYKLSHSQITKIQKLSREGVNRLKDKKETIKIQTDESERFVTDGDFGHDGQDEKNYNHEMELKAIKESLQLRSVNYCVQKDKVIALRGKFSLHVQIINFDFSLTNYEKLQPSPPSSPQAFQHKDIQVICFQIHDQHNDMHFRSEFTYKTLSEQIKFIFEDINELFEYVTNLENLQNKEEKSLLAFNHKSMELEITVKLQQVQKNKIKQRSIRIPLLPYAVIQVVQKNQHQEFQEKNQLLQKINSLKNDLAISKDLIYALRQENQKLKEKLNKQRKQTEKQKAQKEMLIQSYQKLSKVSEKTKEFYFEFVPDPKAKNISNFLFKNNILKKVKNDIKWDQVSSQAPLPKAGRHYFSFGIIDFLPDFMFGIVTVKAKDTINAFLGQQTICLYASKNNSYIYERGRNYKINVNIKRGDLVFVIVDRDKGVIEWVKRRKRLHNHIDIMKLKENDEDRQVDNPHQRSLTLTTDKSLASIPNQARQQQIFKNKRALHKQRKNSETLSCELTDMTKNLSQENFQRFKQSNEEIEYIHSTKIAQQMLSRELYSYIEVYNINEPLSVNEKK